MRFSSYKLVLLGSLFISAMAQASPTSNEFLICHKIAASFLHTCLDENTDAVRQNNCWQDAKRKNLDCYRQVQLSHQVDKKRRAAEIAAREKYLQEKNKAESPASTDEK